MKQSNLLLITTIAMTLTACSSGGSSGGISTTTNPTGNVNGLTQNYTIPTYLKDSVDESLKLYIDSKGAKGYDSIKITSGALNQSYNYGDAIEFSEFPLGFSDYTMLTSDDSTINNSKGVIYRMPYSVVLQDKVTESRLASEDLSGVWMAVSGGTTFGHYTNELPSSGEATYTGVALSGEDRGKLNLSVNFDTKVTEGHITGLNLGQITLEKGQIQSVDIERVNSSLEEVQEAHIGFKGEATIANANIIDETIVLKKDAETTIEKQELSPSKFNYRYEGVFYGPNAEEVGGTLEAVSKENAGHVEAIANFGGQRGSIQK